MKEKIKDFLETKKEIVNILKKFVVNKEISLDDRWNLFIESDLGEIDSFYMEPPGIDWNKKSLYDDFHADKYSTVLATDMLETINDEAEEFNWNDNKQKEFKEFFLKEFTKGFIHDW